MNVLSRLWRAAAGLAAAPQALGAEDTGGSLVGPLVMAPVRP
jgi:hypothetical protein